MSLFDFTDVEWGIAKSILNILEAVDKITTILSDEKYVILPNTKNTTPNVNWNYKEANGST